MVSALPDGAEANAAGSPAVFAYPFTRHRARVATPVFSPIRAAGNLTDCATSPVPPARGAGLGIRLRSLPISAHTACLTGSSGLVSREPPPSVAVELRV